MVLNSVLKFSVFLGLVLFSAQYARAETSGESLDKLLSDLKGNPVRESNPTLKSAGITTYLPALRSQLGQCWKPKPNYKSIEIKIDSLPDGTVKAVKVVNTQGQEDNEAFIESAKAAMDIFDDPNCKRLNLPNDQYEEWKTVFVRLD